MSRSRFTDRERSTLDALCRSMAPAAYAVRPAVDLVAAVEARMALADPTLFRQVAVLLRVWDHPVSGLISCGRPRRFSACPPEVRARWLARWEASALAPQRTIFQALRRLVLSTAYGHPAVQREIGYLPPLHTRAPAFAWEGPLAGGDGARPVAHAPPGDRRVPPPTAPHRVPEGVLAGAALGDGARVRADVCVIGTGAGGAVAAARLAEAGFDVVLLEEGSYWAPEQFSEQELDAMARLYADAGTRATDDLSLSILQGRSVGGSTTINWLIMLRARDHVLEEWAREHGVEGMRPAEMAAVYDLVERETHTAEVPDAAHSPNNRIILDGAARLGWSARPARINAQGCVRAGSCGMGCRYGARRGPTDVYLPRALAAGARLYTETRADRVEIAERGGAAPLKRVHATVLDRESGAAVGRVRVEAPLVVLAAGAVGTPVLLQRSGLGGGGVGRFLRLHPTTGVAATYAETVYPAAGIPLSAVCDEFADGADGYGFWIECPPAHPALVALSAPGFGERHHREMLDYRRTGTLIVLVRDGADRARSSGSVGVDRRGRPRIEYRLSAPDRANVVAGVTAAARLHLAAGAEEVRTLHAAVCAVRSEAELERIARQRYGPNRFGLFSAHVNGTCRIGRDARTSGCTPDGERHGAPGVYVADGSLMPTAPGVNPQETVMAMASVVAGRIVERHRAVRG